MSARLNLCVTYKYDYRVFTVQIFAGYVVMYYM